MYIRSLLQGLPGSALQHKELEGCHSKFYNKKKLLKLRLTDCSWKLECKAIILKSGVQVNLDASSQRSAYLDQKFQEPSTSKNTYVVILMNYWRLNMVIRNSWGPQFQRDPYTFMCFTYRNPTSFLWERSEKDLAGGEE